MRQTKLRSHSTASLIINCKGDEPGTGLGVKSNTVGSICQPKTWSKTVKFEGHHAVRHNDEWWMNNKNTFGKLFYVKNVDTHDATPQSKQAWRQTASESGAAPGPDLKEGRSVAASPDPVRYAQASTGTATDASPAISPAVPASIALGVAAVPAAEGMIGAGGLATAAEGMVFVPGVGWVILGVGALGLIVWAMTRDNVRVSRTKKENECKRTVVISRSKSPKAAQHIADAQAAGHPSILTYDSAGASARRAVALTHQSVNKTTN